MLEAKDLAKAPERVKDSEEGFQRGSFYRFGPFVLNPGELSLLRDGRPCGIQPQPLRVLTLLASRPARLTTRDELRREIWGDEFSVDHEHGLNFAINQIRTALGDSARDPRYIETVPRAGYRFIASVSRQPVPPEAVPPTPSEPDAAPAESSPSSKGRPPTEPSRAETRAGAGPEPTPTSPPGRPIRKAMSVVLLAALTALALWTLRNDAPPPSASVPASTPAPIRIAVLPFESTGRDAALAKGMTFDLIAYLGRLAPGQLEVIGYRSMIRLGGTDLRVAEIGRRLNVSYVIEGQVSSDRGAMQVKAMLIDGGDEAVRWSTAADLPIAELVGAPRGMAEEIISHLFPKLETDAETENRKAQSPPMLPLDPSIYALFAESRWKFSSGIGDQKEAIEGLYEVVRLGPGFAPGQATLALALALNSFGSDQLAIPAALQAAEIALTLNPNSADAYLAQGLLRAYAQRDLEGGRDLIARALALEPGNAIVLATRAGLEAVMGHPENSGLMTDLAVKLDPLSGNAWLDAGYADYLAHRFEQARDRCEGSLALGTNSRLWASNCLLNSSEALGDLDGMERAIDHLLEALDAKNPLPQELSTSERATSVRQLQVEHLLPDNDTAILDYTIATQKAALGLKDEAMFHLEESYRRRDMLLPFASVDPVFELLADEPRFQRLVADLGLATTRH
ncbi:MAG: winged helix-turn-helix domain-containing protein [Deltaproteobacteria bacterium]|nr:winged helix-turn-helix domain-containing protein [Deltaproteobacteria bacterium]